MLYVFLLSACSSRSTLGADLLDRMDDVRAEVASHQASVDSATSLDEVSRLEADHHARLATMMDDMSGMMDDMMGCGMGMGRMGMMSDADGHMGAMMDEVDAHQRDHEGYTDLSTCMDDEAAYVDAMDGHLDSMGMDADGFDGEARCSGGGGMM